MRVPILAALLTCSALFIGCLGGSGSPSTPTAANDSYRVSPDAQLAVAAPGILENDSDTFWVDSFDTSSVHGGTVVVDTDGGFQYNPPNSTFVGQDSYTYTATDGEIYQTCTVLIRVAWVQYPEITKLLASDAQAGDYFGISVAVSGNIAVVGAQDEDTGGTDAGAAYIFECDSAGNWSEVGKLTASDAHGNDLFGYSVAVSGNIAVVGALYEDTGGTDAGAVCIFEQYP